MTTYLDIRHFSIALRTLTLMSSLSRIAAQIRRRWVYGLMSVLVAMGLIMGSPQPGQAFSLIDLIFRGIQVIQLSNLSDSQEVELGRRINSQLVSQEFNLYRDSSITQYVDQIGQRLVPHSERPDIPYTFQVVNDDAINAFATMGGYVYVTTGLIEAADNEAQLASVLAHEVGHIEAHHAVEQMRERAIAQGIAGAAGLDRNVAVNIGVELAVNRPNSRQDELEADQKGLNSLRKAGYAPVAMVNFMQKLVSQRSIPTFLSTHPATGDRITALQNQIDPATASNGDGLNNSAYRSRTSSLR